MIGTEVKADVIREFLLTIITGKSRSSNIYIYTHMGCWVSVIKW